MYLDVRHMITKTSRTYTFARFPHFKATVEKV